MFHVIKFTKNSSILLNYSEADMKNLKPETRHLDKIT